MIRGVHHVALIVSEYAKSKHFYTEILGAEIVNEVFRPERNSHKLNLRLPGGIELEIFDFPRAPARLSRPEAQGLRHLAFRVTDLDGAISYLETNGVSVEPVRIDEWTGACFTFFADPDGLPHELVGEAKTNVDGAT